MYVLQICYLLLKLEVRSILETGAPLGFFEDKHPNIRKRENQYKTKNKQYKSYIGDNFLITRSYKIRHSYYSIKNFFKEVKRNLFLRI